VNDARTERIEANNQRFKEANESIRDRADALGAEMERLPFLCECPDEHCVEILQLTATEYGAIRDRPDYYMTAVGHEQAEFPVGRVVERRDHYVIVEKPNDDS